MLIKEQIETLEANGQLDSADTMEKLLDALQEIVDYHQDYHAPLNKDFDTIQDIAIAVLRDIDDPVPRRLTQETK